MTKRPTLRSVHSHILCSKHTLRARTHAHTVLVRRSEVLSVQLEALPLGSVVYVHKLSTCASKYMHAYTLIDACICIDVGVIQWRYMIFYRILYILCIILCNTHISYLNLSTHIYLYYIFAYITVIHIYILFLYVIYIFTYLYIYYILYLHLCIYTHPP
jgi:hypothetical protein